jgi:tetratricopeptide (TPR) repeat protein
VAEIKVPAPPLNSRAVAPAPAASPVPAPVITAPKPVPQVAPQVSEPKPVGAPPVASAGYTASAAAHYQKGRDLLKVNKFKEAIDELTLSIQGKAADPLAYNARGFSYYMVRDYEHAVADLNEAVRIKPDYANAKLNLSVATKAAEKAKK